MQVLVTDKWFARQRLAAACQKSIQQGMAMLGQNGFRVELYALHVQLAMPQPHNGFTLSGFIGGPGSHF